MTKIKSNDSGPPHDDKPHHHLHDHSHTYTHLVMHDAPEDDHDFVQPQHHHAHERKSHTHHHTHSSHHGHDHDNQHTHHDPDQHHISLFKKMSEYWHGSRMLGEDGHTTTTATTTATTLVSPTGSAHPKHESSTSTPSGILLTSSKPRGGKVIKDLWKVCCAEVAVEREDCNNILTSLGLPPLQFCKDKSYPLTDYEVAPDPERCKGKDYLDFYLFPVLLPGIQSLLQFARDSGVFQCRFHSFEPLDYLVHYLHNNNPRHPERGENHVDLMDIPYVKEWTHEHPRRALAKWLTMPKDEAARIIQRYVRGYFVRIRPHIQEMRQFWKQLHKEKFEAKLRAVQSWRQTGAKMTFYMAALTIQKAIRGFFIRRQPAVAEMRLSWEKKRGDKEGGGGGGSGEFSFDFTLDTLLDLHDFDGDDSEGGVDGDRGGSGENKGDENFIPHSEICPICAKFSDFVKTEEIKSARERERDSNGGKLTSTTAPTITPWSSTEEHESGDGSGSGGGVEESTTRGSKETAQS